MRSYAVLMWLQISASCPHRSAPSVNMAQQARGLLGHHHLITSCPMPGSPGQPLRLRDQENLPWAGYSPGLHMLWLPMPSPPQPFPTLPLSTPPSALSRTRPADQHPLCTASLNYGFSVWKKLCWAGSCPFSHVSSAVLPLTCTVGLGLGTRGEGRYHQQMKG